MAIDKSWTDDYVKLIEELFGKVRGIGQIDLVEFLVNSLLFGYLHHVLTDIKANNVVESFLSECLSN